MSEPIRYGPDNPHPLSQMKRVYSKLVRDMAYYRCQDDQPFNTGAAPCLITQMPLYTSFMSSSNLC
jgi:hypothetical protein